MMGLPLAFVGSFGLLLALPETPLTSILCWRLVLLVGLPTKNGILLVELTNQRRRDRDSLLNDAIIEAAGIRLRPILMTAVSTMAGVIPVAFGIGVGGESRQPMAVAIAGGMLSSTILTLMVTPVIYSYLDGFTRLRIFGFLKKKIWVDEQENGRSMADSQS